MIARARKHVRIPSVAMNATPSEPTEPRSASSLMAYMFALTRPDLKPPDQRSQADIMLLEWRWRHAFHIPQAFPFPLSFVGAATKA